MPLIVDREQERKKILKSFEACLREKPFDKITLRDISDKCGMAPSTLLNYYESRQEIASEFIQYVITETIGNAREWINTHSCSDFDSPKEYVLNLFNTNAKFSKESKAVYAGVLNTYLLAQYEDIYSNLIRDENMSWAKDMYTVLTKELNMKTPNPDLARMILVCNVGLSICTFNGWFDSFTFESTRNFISDIIIDQTNPR